MQIDSPITGVAHSIQLAVAPVFLLSGVASFLIVLTNRLARIIDRTRTLETLPGLAGDPAAAAAREELRVLVRRAQLINRAIGSCTYCALLVASVVAVLFVGAFLRANIGTVVGVAFIAAMVAFIAGLLHFLWEVHVAIRFMRETAPQVGRGARDAA